MPDPLPEKCPATRHLPKLEASTSIVHEEAPYPSHDIKKVRLGTCAQGTTQIGSKGPSQDTDCAGKAQTLTEAMDTQQSGLKMKLTQSSIMNVVISYIRERICITSLSQRLCKP